MTPITPTEQEIREVIALKWASGGLAEPGDWVRKATEGDQETLAQVRRWRGLITRYRRREGEEEAREHIARVVSEMDAWIAREPERRAEQEERATAAQQVDKLVDDLEKQLVALSSMNGNGNGGHTAAAATGNGDGPA